MLWATYWHPMPSDYAEVRSWVQHWLVSGTSPYGAPGLQVDYLPHALLLFAPLAVLPDATGALWFAVLSVCLAAAGTVLLVVVMGRLAGARLTSVEVAATTAMFMSVRPMRLALLGGQTMPFALLLSAVALTLARQRPLMAGVCLALAAYKLNVAAAFGLALLLFGQFVPIAWALLVFVGMTWLTSAVIGETVWALLRGYAVQVTTLYGGADFLRGATGIRPVLASVIPDIVVVNVAAVLFGAGLLVTMVELLRRVRHRREAAPLAVACAMLWALAVFPHQLYNVVLAAPAVLLVHWPESTLVKQPRLRWLAACLALVYLLPSVPGDLQRALEPSWFRVDEISGGWLTAVWPHRARMFVFMLLALCLAELVRLVRTGPVRMLESDACSVRS